MARGGLIFDYLEEMEEEEIGIEFELDPIAVCCDFTEANAAVVASNYLIDIDNVRQYLTENTTLVGETPKGFVYVSF